MRAFWSEFVEQLPASVEILLYAFLLLVVTWPVFLLLERWAPAPNRDPRASTVFNWKIVASNLLLAPSFYALAMAGSTVLAGSVGLPGTSVQMVIRKRSGKRGGSRSYQSRNEPHQ